MLLEDLQRLYTFFFFFFTVWLHSKVSYVPLHSLAGATAASVAVVDVGVAALTTAAVTVTAASVAVVDGGVAALTTATVTAASVAVVDVGVAALTTATVTV